MMAHTDEGALVTRWGSRRKLVSELSHGTFSPPIDGLHELAQDIMNLGPVIPQQGGR